MSDRSAGAPQAGAPRSFVGIWRGRWLVAGLTVLGFALRVAGLEFQSLWRDEIDAIRFAGQPLDQLGRMFATPGHNGPLYYLLLRPWLALAGDGAFALRFFSLLFGVVTVPLSYRLARRLFPARRAVALLAAGLAATSPYLVWYSQEGKMYALVTALILFSMDRYLAALDSGGWARWLAYVLVTSAALYVHLLAALILPVQVLIALLLKMRGRGPAWKPWLASLALLTLPYLPLFFWQAPLLLRPAQTGYRFVPLHEMLYSLLLSYGLGVVWRGGWWLVALFVGLLLAAFFLGRRAGFRLVTLGALGAWLLVPILGLFLVSLVRPLYTARYLIFVLPAFLLLLAVGLLAVARRSRLLGGLLLAALLAANGLGLWHQATTPLKADFRAATDYVAAHLSGDDLLLFQIPYGRFSFDYYYQRRPIPPPKGGPFRVFLPWAGASDGEPYRWAEGLYTNAGLPPAEAERRMAEVVGDSRVVWLVATEVSMWDERGLVKQWLDEHGTLTRKASFVRVTVYRYEFR